MSYSVTVLQKIARKWRKLPKDVQKLLFLLIEDLKDDGPFQTTWPNYSPLGEDKYHCHLKYSWVACWTWHKGTIEIEVYYAGSREDAPY